MSKEKIQQTPPPLRTASPDDIEMSFRVNPRIEAKIDKFLADNPAEAAYLTKLVKEHPERAIRTLAKNSMFRQENVALKNTIQMKQADEFVSQYPGLKEKISEGIQTKNPIWAGAAFIRRALGLQRSVEGPNIGGVRASI